MSERKVVNIVIEIDKTGLMFATSPELKGLLVSERSVERLITAIQCAIVEMYSACEFQ